MRSLDEMVVPFAGVGPCGVCVGRPISTAVIPQKEMFMSALRYALAVGVLSIGLAPLVHADEPKKSEAKPVESKPEKDQTAATSINFAQILDLPFPCLIGLGARIEEARMAADPVSLGVAAKELAVAEAVSGKKAELTADALNKEVLNLAKMRGSSAELKAVKLLTDSKDAGPDLDKAIAVAVKREDEEAKSAAEGKKTRGITRELIVDNRTGVSINIYLNGNYKGVAAPHSVSTFSAHNFFETNVMEGRGAGGVRVWRQTIAGQYDTYTWVLIP
jgi:hypothetical protein